MFHVDVWMPQGTDIQQTIKQSAEVEAYLESLEHVDFVASTVGQGMQRFMLTYQPEQSYAAFAQMTVRVDTRKNMFLLLDGLEADLNKNFAHPTFRLRVMEFGPTPGSKIEARITGSDPDILRSLALQIEDEFNADPGARNIRHDWRERTKELVPQFNESKARRLGISKQDLSSTLQMAFGGNTIGIIRDGTHMLPVIARLPEEERVDFESLENLNIWSPTLQTYIPIEQIIDGVKMEWIDPLILRRDRKRTLTVMADHDVLGDETAASLFARLRPKVEEITLPEGYELSWGGEYESTNDAQAAMFSSLPLGALVMFIITVFLFNSVRKPLVIWFTVPLAIIGVSMGLLATGLPFSFTALLGLLSLSGMILKNGIVLMDQINIELATGKDAYKAVVDSALSRVRPVSMAAMTTILGMVPLMFDPFFGSMAITIMAGLGFATVLTLIVVPVLFSIFYKVKPATA